MRRAKRAWGWAAVLCMAWDPCAWAQRDWRPVLVVASDHSQSRVEAEQIAGLRSALPPDTDMLIEYLDAKHINGRRFYPEYYESLLFAKYKTRNLSAVVALNQEAIHIVKRYRSNIFRPFPLILCGSRLACLEGAAGLSNVTEVVGMSDAEETIHLALDLHPNAKDVYLLANRTTPGRMTREQAAQTMGTGRFPIAALPPPQGTAWSSNNLLDFVRSLPPESVVILTEPDRDRRDEVTLSQYVIPFISRDSKAPVYTTQSEAVGSGAIGGHVAAGRQMGRQAGEMVKRILLHESAGDIPLEVVGGEWVFDDAQLKRWGIADRVLPPGSRIINRELSYYEKNKQLLWGGGVILSVESAIIALLLVNRAGRIRAQRALQASAIRYRSLFESTRDMLVILDAEGRIRQVNPEVARRLGYSEEELQGMAWADLILAEDRARLRSQMRRACEGEQLFEETYYLSREGTEIPVELLFQSYSLENRAVVLCIGRNLAERFKMQRLAWGIREREQSRMGQELHDGLCQELKSIELGLVECEERIHAAAPAAHELLRTLQGRMNDAVKQAYMIARDLLPLGPEVVSLPEALRLLVYRLNPQQKAMVSLHAEAGLDIPGRETARQVFRIAQEALQNALCHAGATSIQIRWTRNPDGHCLLVVRDNGRGMSSKGPGIGGLGLFIMRSRAQNIGAILTIVQPPEGGTEVRCACPACEHALEPA